MMTIPSRPAPPPPQTTATAAQNVTTTATGRLQQNTHQMFNLNNGGVGKLTIKLPPPPNSNRSGSGTSGNSFTTNRNNINFRTSSSASSSSTSSSSGSITRKFPQANILRYSPTTNWDGIPFESTTQHNGNSTKKIPPPRPPPPKIVLTDSNGSRNENVPRAIPPHQQSINILTNIFNRKKSTKTIVGGGLFHQKKIQKNSGRTTPNQLSSISSSSSSNTTNWSSNLNSQNHTNYGIVGGGGHFNQTTMNSAITKTSSLSSIIQSSSSSSSIGQTETQLISFDSPPSSPTFTQKSNSDCVSVDSFSSDSNFSSPNNGNASQPESGFEDDFIAASRRTTSPLDPWETLDTFADTGLYDAANTIGTAPVRNLSIINTRIQNSNDNLLCNGKSLLPPVPSLTMPTIIKPKISQKPQAPKPPTFSGTFNNSSNAVKNSNYDDVKSQNDDEEEDNDNEPGTPPSPPMPKCPPPPPPPLSANGFSMLDVINGKVDILSLDNGGTNAHSIPQDNVEPYGIALYDFDGAVDGDLSFRENEKIYILEKLNEEWFRGRTRSGCEGIFPANYIDIKVPLAAAAEFKKPYPKAQNQTSNKILHQIPQKVRCLYRFNPEETGDLPLNENDYVTVLYKINDDWLYGEINGKKGQFPASFLEFVPTNLPIMPSC